MNKIIIILGILLLSIVLVLANENHQSEIEEGKKLVESAISCDKLNNEQLEAIGNYYMEQMHPGEAHEYMDRMMGGEDSESLKQMHIQMAKGIYCKENVGGMMGGGMMGEGMMGGGMIGGGMMGNYDYQNPQNNNLSQNSFIGFQIFFYIILVLIVIILVLVTILLINKSKQKGRKTK